MFTEEAYSPARGDLFVLEKHVIFLTFFLPLVWYSLAFPSPSEFLPAEYRRSGPFPP